MSVCRSSSTLLRVAPCLRSQSSAGAAFPRYFHQTIVPQDDAPSKAPPYRSRSSVQAERNDVKYAEARQKRREGFRPYTDEEMAALKQYYTPQQIEALEASEKAVDVEDLTEQGIPRIDQWALEYVDDLSKIDPLLDKKVVPEVTDAPRIRFRDEQDFVRDVSEKMIYGGMGMPEMYYAIERSDLSEKIKAGLRTLKRWKGTHKESAVKGILWKFVPKAANAIQAKDGETSVAELFDTIEQLDLPAVKKAEIAALRHWAGTEKEAALRPMLERYITNTPKASTTFKDNSGAEQDMSKLKGIISEKLGFDPTDDLWFVEGSGKTVLNDDIYSVQAADIPKFKDPGVRYKGKEEDDPVSAALARLSLETGHSLATLKSFRQKALVSHRVANMTRMGKIYTIYTLTVAGNENGMLGIGQGKSAEYEDSRIQSYINAIRNMRPIHRYENRTVYGEVKGKVGGATVELSSRPPGFGLRTQHLVFEVARCAGIRDLSARVGRSRNPMNTVKATVEALTSQKLPEEIARARGKKLVDVRKVYYAGTVY